MIDERPQEIILISLCNISVNSEIVDDEIDFDLSLQLIQIDNQLPNSPFPVLLQCLNPNNANFFHAIGSLRTHFVCFIFLFFIVLLFTNFYLEIGFVFEFIPITRSTN